MLSGDEGNDQQRVGVDPRPHPGLGEDAGSAGTGAPCGCGKTELGGDFFSGKHGMQIDGVYCKSV
ncbi:hypothetical protein LOAG_12310 [Loa loa]|uniref:Uncharacterized protein n=1 Tax=Loa loa TaxID=7209 RepID=A0A1I7VVJ6_LOALO|nr:hypothetical protein LOAG_12310 [Loa loa]EFO16200.1 hypothetical protein LOAG_12310 [Loa loa]